MTAPGEHAGAEADAAITRVPGAKLAVRTADCVPVVLVAEGGVGIIHAGWRGLAAGIVQRTVDELGSVQRAVVGPHIRAGCYEFGEDDLREVTSALGDEVRATTTWGAPALDLTRAVRAALRTIPLEDAGACTACSDVYYSWRARRESARFATIAWMS